MNKQIEGAAPAGAPAPAAPTPQKSWGAGSFIRYGLVCVLILLIGFFGWGATAKLAGAVIATGQLRVETNRQVVQHLDGGVVEEILVREGDRVMAGDVLIRLDSARLDAELAALESQLFEIMARRGRLEAVQTGADQIAFDPELIEAGSDDPEVVALMIGQQKLFDAQRVSLEKERDVLAERKAQLGEQIRGAEAEIASYERQIELIAEELIGMRQLLASGNVPKTRVLALEREEARLQGERGQLISRVAQLKGQISELDIELLRMTANMLEEAIAESRELGYRELELRERRLSLQEQLSRLDVRAPSGGIILDMSVHALQAVVRPADPILYVVPDDAELVIDARFDPLSRDEIFPTQDAVMRFSAFNARTTPEIFGRIKTISPDVSVDEQSGMSFYKVEVSMLEGEIDKLEGQRLVAGMPVEVFVQTEKRTPLNYLMRPITDYFYRAGRQD
ncbi:MAG: HlyD family type I secretion periplasmic adaptor subunit [Pseudomonadota bacterium]